MYLRLNPYDEILQGLLVSLRIDEGIVKITGRNGAGKSALCSQLCDDLQANAQPAIFFAEPPSNAAALHDAIAGRLHLDSSGNFTRALSAWLQARNADEKPLVLVFDDAQRLDPPTFSAIRMLCNIQSGSSSLVRVVLCGSDELDARIASPALRAVTQFISQSFTLGYLTREQVRDFRQAYCGQPGHDLKAIDERALDRLFSDTKGQPGLLYARLEQENATRAAQQTPAPESVAEHTPDIAAGEALLASYDDRKPASLRALAIVFGLLIVAGAGAYVYFASPATPAAETAGPGDANVSAVPAITANAPAGAPRVEAAAGIPADADTAETEVVEALAGEQPRDEAAMEQAQSVVPASDLALSPTSPTVLSTSVAPALEQSTPAAPAVDASPPEAPVTAAAQAPAPVQDFIASWIASWQAQDVEAYLAHYHRDFAPMQGTRAAWEQQRRRVIENATDIVISVDAPQSNAEAQDGMRVVRFWLNYRAANYADRTLKEVVLARVDGAWRIRAERNLRTEAQ